MIGDTRKIGFLQKALLQKNICISIRSFLPGVSVKQNGKSQSASKASDARRIRFHNLRDMI